MASEESAKDTTEARDTTDTKDAKDTKSSRFTRNRTTTEATGTSGTPGKGSAGVAKTRAVLAQVIWLLFVLAALFLAVGALLIALDANEKNNLVQFVLDGADAVDLGVFSVDNGIMKFTGENADTKNALFNWGIGAVVWLVVGRILDRVVRP